MVRGGRGVWGRVGGSIGGGVDRGIRGRVDCWSSCPDYCRDNKETCNQFRDHGAGCE